MDSSLSSILGEEAPTTEAATEQQTAATQSQQEVGDDNGATGEVQTASPAASQKDDNLDKARKGLEAAAKAERERRQAAEARAEAAERRAQELEQKFRQPPQQTQQRQQEQDDDPKPLRANFATEDEWLDARDAWRDRQRETAAAMDKAQRQAEETYRKTEGIYAEASKLEGFSRAAFDALPLTQPIVRALVESDHAPALMHFMAANPAEVERIGGLSETRQIAEMARIEDKLAAQAATTDDEGQNAPRKKVELPNTLTQARNARGQFEPAYSGPTPLNSILR